MRPDSLLGLYHELKESGSASDFPMLMGNLMYRRLIQWFNKVPQDWRDYVRIIPVNDYRPQTLVLGSEMDDLLWVGINGIYQDSRVFDRYSQVQATVWGRTFRIPRSVIINDDLGYIQQQPERFGRAAQRTLSKFVPRSILEANPPTFDGQALFSTTHTAGSGTYSNLLTGPSSGLSVDAVQVILQSMAVALSFDGTLRPVDARRLVVPPALKMTALAILRSTNIIIAGGQVPVVRAPELNPVGPGINAGVALDLTVDRYLTSNTAWYTFAEADDVPAVAVGFMKGKETPDLLVLRPQMYNLAGGEDPYMLEYDEMAYKVRFEFGGAPVAWWGAFKSAGA